MNGDAADDVARHIDHRHERRERGHAPQPERFGLDIECRQQRHNRHMDRGIGREGQGEHQGPGLGEGPQRLTKWRRRRPRADRAPVPRGIGDEQHHQDGQHAVHAPQAPPAHGFQDDRRHEDHHGDTGRPIAAIEAEDQPVVARRGEL